MHDELSTELSSVAGQLREIAEQGESPEVLDPLRSLMTAADAVAAAWSGSVMGYHARVYYKGFAKVPPGARWSKEWGFYPAISNEGQGSWEEYATDDVLQHIRTTAGNPDLAPVEEASLAASRVLDTAQGEIDSILATFQNRYSDELVRALREQASKTRAITQQQAAQAYMPRGQIITRDMQALGEGFVLPPHLAIQSKIVGLKAPFAACEELAEIARRAGDHIARLGRTGASTLRESGDRVFIGHGRSLLWLEMKEFVTERLKLSHEEFNRVPVAGISNTARLAQMLDAAAFAFLVLTAEDELADGSEVARQNVVHEAGLFQGKLGNERAILMLEEGCEEFSNIHGIGQIRFPKGNIAAVFEDVRRVLEREGLIPSSESRVPGQC